jgi:hypothetical protein
MILRVDTTSTTSGIRSSPLRPTTSTGTPACVSASCTAPAVLLSRTSTPMLLHVGTGMASWAFGTSVARKASSSSYVGRLAVRTVPASGEPAGSSGRLPRWIEYSGPASALAVCRMRASDRRLTLSGNRRTSWSSARGKSSPKPSMLLTEAPRQP